MPRFRFWLLPFFALFAVAGLAAADSFIDKLSPEQRHRMGLDQLTPAQLAELDAAVQQFRRDGAVTAAQEAAATAVAEYKKKEEPSVITRALDLFRRKQEEEKEQQVRFTATITGKFTGWEGRTVFTLDNGQVWRQQGTDVYATKAQENPAVLLYKAKSGHWRLQLIEEGAWITVVRIK
jgi:hypothetical protein